MTNLILSKVLQRRCLELFPHKQIHLIFLNLILFLDRYVFVFHRERFKNALCTFKQHSTVEYLKPLDSQIKIHVHLLIICLNTNARAMKLFPACSLKFMQIKSRLQLVC